MEALFLKLVNMSITASWLVLAIIAVRLVFSKTPKWILCLLWGLVAFRLICPFSIESALSLIPNPEPLPQDIIYTAHPQLQSGIIIVDNTINPMLESSMTPIEPASANPTQIWSFILYQVWILGMVLMLLYTVISYLLLKRNVATAIPLVKGIKQSEFIDSPFVLGLIRPVIYLPFGMEEADMAYVIAHEKAHIRRRDHWWKPLGFLLLSIYWFNPVLWVAYILLCGDIEAACDEKVIKDMEKDERRAYSTALLNCSIHRGRIAACPLAFGETGVKARVKSVMNYRKPAFWVILIALLVSIVVAICFLTNPKSEEEDTSGYEMIQTVTAQDGYTIVGQESTKINLVIEKAKLPDACFTLKGHTFEPKEVIPYQTFADNKLYLKHVGIDEERSEYLRFTFAFQTDSLELESLMLPYHVDIPGNGFICNVEVNRGEAWDNQKTYENVAYFEPVMNGEGFCVLVKKAICESADHHIAFMLNDMNRLTYEVRESVSPVTITLENVRPTGATILFHQNKDLIDGSLWCDYEYFLQQQVNGKWENLPKVQEIPFPDQTYDIAMLHHNGVDWEHMYGRLPVGYYRLGKVIPITSGENPEYTTVYAEFSVDHVYTWFDKSSADASERNHKDNLVDLFGMENVSLSYHPDENAIYLINAEGRKVIITCDAGIRNVFLTDLTGDGVSEVCATIRNGVKTQVQVYDASEQMLYELQEVENGYDLTKKADRLCICRFDEYGNPVGYWQLTLQPGEGIVLADLDPEVETLKSKLVCVDINTRRRTCLSSAQELNQIMTLLRDLEDSVVPATAVELEEAENDGFNTTWITVNYELGKKNLFFSKDFDLVWEVGSTEAFRIPDPGLIRQFFEFVTDGVRNRETSGEPFATVDSPWDWCAAVNSDVISNAEVYVCLDVTSSGNSVNITGTNGYLPSDSLQRLIPILNRIPHEAFTKTDKYTSDYGRFVHGDQLEGSCSVSLIDEVNEMAVVIRACKGSVEMILTGELEKAQPNNHDYLSSPTVIWTVKDPALRTYLDDVRENTPIINYSVGAEYEWHSPIEFSKGKFNLSLYLIEDWIYEDVNNSTNSGIRCRPKDVEEGWIYFSFWPDGYEPEETDRFINEGMHYGGPWYISYPVEVSQSGSYDVTGAIWSYQRICTSAGDYAIINESADSWFMEYQDQIEDAITISEYTVE